MGNYVNADGSGLVGALNPTNIGQALQLDNAGNLKVASSNPTVRSASTVWSQSPTVQTSAGSTADLPVGSYSELAVDINLTALSGSSPTLQIFIERKGADDTYYPIWQSVTLSTTTMISTTIGAGMAIAQGFGTTIRLRWAPGGTSPSATFSGSIIGK